MPISIHFPGGRNEWPCHTIGVSCSGSSVSLGDSRNVSGDTRYKPAPPRLWRLQSTQGEREVAAGYSYSGGSSGVDVGGTAASVPLVPHLSLRHREKGVSGWGKERRKRGFRSHYIYTPPILAEALLPFRFPLVVEIFCHSLVRNYFVFLPSILSLFSAFVSFCR